MDPTTTDRTHPTLILAVLSLAGLAYAMLSSSVVPALPTMQHALHTTETGITWLLTAYLLAASVGTAIIGRLGDMYGKERLLLATLVILAAGTLLAAVSNSLGVLIVARFIQGASGGIFPLAFGIVRDEFPREKVAGSIGLLSAILGVGRRRRDRALGRDRRAPQLPLAVLDPARGDAARGGRDLALHPRVARPRPRAHQLAGGRPDDDRHLDRAARDQPRRRPGAGARRGRSASSPSGSPSSPPGSPSRCAARTR